MYLQIMVALAILLTTIYISNIRKKANGPPPSCHMFSQTACRLAIDKQTCWDEFNEDDACSMVNGSSQMSYIN